MIILMDGKDQTSFQTTPLKKYGMNKITYLQRKIIFQTSIIVSILIFQGEIQDNYLGKILMTNIHHFKVHEIYRGRLAPNKITPNKSGALVGYTPEVRHRP